MCADKAFVPRSAGIPSEGVRDQYADGRAARAWNKFIGDSSQRTNNYRHFLVNLLRGHHCRRVLDAACGTGIDSMMLVEEGFQLVSVDASDKMLKHALKARWERRKDPKYDEWVIEEASWETLPRDVGALQVAGGAQFDAVLCLGNSFAHLLDEWGDQRVQRMCLRNFAQCLKPGGLLLIDHRNYDAILDSGATPQHSIYYNCSYPVDIKTSVLVVQGRAQLVALDYVIDTTVDGDSSEKSEFRLCYYPYKLEAFSAMLEEAFEGRADHTIYADFRPLQDVQNPAFYIHVMHKHV